MEAAPAQFAEYIEKGIAFVARSGLKVVELKRGYCKLLMPFAGNENHIGTMYAGALFTVAEIPGGALFVSSFDMGKYYPILKELTMQYRRPARTDITIEMSLSDEQIAAIAAGAEAAGKHEFILEGQLKDASGETVALSRGVYQVRKI